MRLALALSVLALAGAAAPPAPEPRRPAQHAPARVVRAVIVQGDRQTARAYAATAATAYQSEFARPLVVRIEGPTPPAKHPRHVVFTCVTRGCTFAPALQNQFNEYTDHAKDDDGKDVANAYDARASHGWAGAFVVIEAAEPRGTFRVRALPVANPGERAVETWFTLTTE